MFVRLRYILEMIRFSHTLFALPFALLSASLTARDLSWVSGRPPHTHWVYAAKTRYRQSDAGCVLQSGEAPGAFALTFGEAQWAVTPGQSAVLYDGEVCLGGGVIAGATLQED